MDEDRELSRKRKLAHVGNVVFNKDDQVACWVAAQIPGYRLEQDYRALGVSVDGPYRSIDDLGAGVIYEAFNAVHCQVVIATTEPRCLTRGTLFTLFHYPFRQLGLRAISCLVPSSNVESLNYAANLGFEPEAMLRFAAPDGSTLVVMKMLAENCRWISNG